MKRKRRQSLLYLPVKAVLYLIAFLPFPFLYGFSNFLAFLLYRVLRYRLKVVHSNLALAFPEKNTAELRSFEWAIYRNLSDIVVESVKCLTLSKEAISKRCQIKDLHILNRYNEEGRSVVAILGHYGNWEWAALSSAVSVKQQMVVIYKPLKNPFFDELINRTRARFGVKMVPLQKVGRFYIENKDKVYVNCFVADQSPSNRNDLIWTSFLGVDTPVVGGPEKIARKLDHAVIFVSLIRKKRGFYDLRMQTLTDHPTQLSEGEITRLHVRELERQILSDPANWLWTHKRWKNKWKRLKRKEPN